MIMLGIGLWLLTSLITYFIEEAAVLCCDRTQWTHTNRVVIAVWSLMLGPFALVIALEVLFLAEMAEGIAHKHPLVFRH